MTDPKVTDFPESSSNSDRKRFFVSSDLLALLFLILLGILFWNLVDNVQAGFTHDDGVYLEAARGLALGKGFKLMHVVGQPSQVKYPIFFPLLLAPIWFFNPQFPQNLPWFNALQVALTVGAAGIIYTFFTRGYRFPAWLAVLILAIVFGNFYTMYFCTMVMTEAPYLFFSFLTLFYLHRQSLRAGHWPLKTEILAGLLSVITFHVRVPAISLIGATGIWLLLNRQYRNAVIYGGISLFLGLLPWLVWTKTQTPPLTDFNYPLVNAYSNYGLEFWNNMRSAKDYLGGVQKVAIAILDKTLNNMMPILPDFPNLYPPKLYPKIKPWILPERYFLLSVLYGIVGLYLLQIIHTVKLSVYQLRSEFHLKNFHPRAFSIPALYVILYILLITFWNYEDQTTRFLIVMTPLFWLYIFKPFVGTPRLSAASVAGHAGGTEALPTRRPWIKGTVLGVLAVFAAVTGLYLSKNAYEQIHQYRSNKIVARGPGHQFLWGDYQSTFAWIKEHTAPNAPLGAASDVVFGLYTGRPTYYVFWASLKMKNGKYTPDSASILMQDLDRKKVAYLIGEPHMQARNIRGPMNLVARNLITVYRKRFKLVYGSPHHMLGVFKILPPPAGFKY
jgi:hypothetical protein